MMRRCGQWEHSDDVVREALDEAALQWGRTMETEVLGRYDLVDEEKYTGRVTVPIMRQQQLLVRRGLAICAACDGISRTTRPRCGAGGRAGGKSLALDGSEAAGRAANLHGVGWSD